MEVTKVVIDNYTPKEMGTCAEVSLVLDNCFAVHKVQVISGERGLFVAMPNTGVTKIHNSRKRYEDIVHPLNNDLMSRITDVVLNKYNEYVNMSE